MLPAKIVKVSFYHNITCKIVIKTPYLSHVASEDRKSVIYIFPHRFYFINSSTIILIRRRGGSSSAFIAQWINRNTQYTNILERDETGDDKNFQMLITCELTIVKRKFFACII